MDPSRSRHREVGPVFEERKCFGCKTCHLHFSAAHKFVFPKGTSTASRKILHSSTRFVLALAVTLTIHLVEISSGFVIQPKTSGFVIQPKTNILKRSSLLQQECLSVPFSTAMFVSATPDATTVFINDPTTTLDQTNPRTNQPSNQPRRSPRNPQTCASHRNFRSTAAMRNSNIDRKHLPLFLTEVASTELPFPSIRHQQFHADSTLHQWQLRHAETNLDLDVVVRCKHCQHMRHPPKDFMDDGKWHKRSDGGWLPLACTDDGQLDLGTNSGCQCGNRHARWTVVVVKGAGVEMPVPEAAHDVDFEVFDPPKEPFVQPSTEQLVESISEMEENDVYVCGVGESNAIRNNLPEGNKRCKKLVNDFKATWQCGKKHLAWKEKKLVCRTVVMIIRRRGGRFLGTDKGTGHLCEVGDAAATAKVYDGMRKLK